MAKTFWSDTLVSSDVMVSSQQHLGLIDQFTKDQLRMGQVTLLRTIIGIDCAALVHDSNEGSSTLSMGIGVASQEAFLAGTLPDPNTASDFPTKGWIFRARGRVFGFAADAPAVYSWRIDRDIRARRILDNGEPYIIFTNDLNEGGTVALRITGLVRCLWLVR